MIKYHYFKWKSLIGSGKEEMSTVYGVSASRSQQPPDSSQLHLGSTCWNKQLKHLRLQGMACNSAWWLVLKSCSVNSSRSAITLQRALLPSPPRRWASALHSLHCPKRRKARANQPATSPSGTCPELIQFCYFHRIPTLWLFNRYLKGRYSQRLDFSFGCGTSHWFY